MTDLFIPELLAARRRRKTIAAAHARALMDTPLDDRAALSVNDMATRHTTSHHPEFKRSHALLFELVNATLRLIVQLPEDELQHLPTGYRTGGRSKRVATISRDFHEHYRFEYERIHVLLRMQYYVLIAGHRNT